MYFYLAKHSKASIADIKEFMNKPFNYVNARLVNSKSDKLNYELGKIKKEQLRTYKDVEIIGMDNLSPSYWRGFLRSSWISRESNYFTDDLYDNFKRYLKPSFHSYQDGKYLHYSKKQVELSESKPGEQKIKGVVGSGKTFVLAKRAVNAHKRTNERVLILTFNIALKNYIHDKISDVREDFYWDNFRIVNYHEFINSMINNLGIEFEIPDDFDYWSEAEKGSYLDAKYYGNINLFEDHIGNVEKYSTIMIDEVQDYRTSWLRIIKKYFLRQNGEFVVFGDSKQDIYNRVSLVDKYKELVIPDSPGRWSEMNRSFRFTPTIAEFIINYQTKYFSDKYILDELEKGIHEISFEDRIYHKFYKNCDYEKIAEFIKKYSVKLGCHPNDICVLSLRIKTIQEVDRYYRRITNEKTYIMAETKEQRNQSRNNHIGKNKKLHFWMNSGVTKFSTVHSFKGWEIDTLFLIIESGLFRDSYNELIYTGFSRSMRKLIIININDIELSKFIQSLPFVEPV